MNDVSTPMMGLLERFLDVTSQRHKLVVSNMANVDTPGYHTKDLDFRSELTRAVSAGEENVLPIARSVPGLLERPDGNNVSLERESLLLADTQLRFNAAVQLLRDRFKTLSSAIHEGSTT